MAETMKAGPALNVMIAERVIGEVEATAPCGDSLTRTNTFYAPTMEKANDDIRAAYPRMLRDGRLWPAQYIGPAYSQNIIAAWQVVETMRERGYCIEIAALHAVNGPGPHYRASSWRPASDSDSAGYSEHWAESAPHAICLAALAALEASAPTPIPEPTPEGR